ncbi:MULTISPECIES: AAA domain-containing protein [Hymenobacter]|uniref:AAA family ATPase n=2 Tax=Hymenobacter TaxID=89966 RepID=A0ABS6X2W9_9BACT|nr:MULTISPECIES: AAA domain-containing protein [Hymenobacter]MBO3269811.1 AAA family ATPase [Hymenobacter defluvii]MBW3130186.1 AAA family ATPase [Hymenobacter profundi]
MAEQPIYTDPYALEKELRHTQALLKLEQQEDLEQFKIKSAKTTIAERQQRGLTWYPVKITQEDIGFGGKLVLELERPAGQNGLHLFQVGKNAALFGNIPNRAGSDRPTLNGVITSVKRNKILLATNKEDLPDWVDDGKLGVDLTFDEVSYREMEYALGKVMGAYESRLAELRDVLLGARPARFRPDSEVQPYYPSPLNDSQLAAVRHVLAAQDVAIIHGPPGTGKTTTLVQAILETIRRERRVLVCAPSNTAVDLLTEKLAERGVNVIRMGNPSRVSDLLLQHTLDAQIMAHKSYPELKSMRQTAEQYREMAGKFKRHFGWEEREQRRVLKQQAHDLLQESDQLERYITEDLLEQVQVITCTLVGASNRAIRHLTYETVFIDEAAQALEPGCWIPIGKANRVVLAGDHQQLPPTVKSEKAGALRETLFEKCIKRQPDTARMLTVQYRMHELIMEFSSEQFYDGKLIAHDTVAHADLSAYDLRFAPDVAVEFLDTAGFGFLELGIAESRSVANPEEADLLLKRLSELLAVYAPEEHQEDLLTVGVIAPYRAQINYLKDAVEDLPELAEMLTHRLLSIGTVDSFQGQERDIICITMTRSNSQGDIGFLSDIRRMNVGMTRARKKLLIVGDSSTLGSHPFYKAFLDYTELIGAYRTAWEMQ